MSLFKTYSFKWWQIGIFKLALLSIGILIGSYWNEFWNDFSITLVVIAIISSVYIMYVSLSQR